MPLVALAPASGSQDLDRYELLFRFAAGGMAEVFVARQRGEGGFLRPVAVKRMLPALAEEPRFVDMFLDEARLAALVQSPYVVPTLDCGKDEEGSPYIVMELVVGLSLSQALRGSIERKAPVPPEIMVEIIAQTALGLYDAHHARTPTGQALEIVHRDVSPQNVLVGVDGRARLTDFGVARALERVSRTTTGEVKGKLSYFSPEQARMEAVDQRSDIFALGVVAWEVLALERLFSRDNPMAAIQAVLHERIPDVRELNPDVPEKLAKAVAKALERDLSARYQTAREFAEDLRASVGSPASPTVVGQWIEQAGGARLAAFRKRIEQAFAATSPTSEVRPIAESPSKPSASVGGGSGSGSERGLFGNGTPLSNVVGQLRTVPDKVPDEGTDTQVRLATPAQQSLERSIAIDLASVVSTPAERAAPARRGPPVALLAGVVAGLLLAVVVGVYYSGGTSPASPASPVAAAPPVAPVEAPAVPSAAPLPSASPSVPSGVAPPLLEGTAPSVAETDGRRRGSAPRVIEPSPQVAPRRTGEPRLDEEPQQPAAGETPVAVRPEPEPTRTEPEPPRPVVSEPPPAEPTPADPPPSRLRVGTGAGRLRGTTP